jgi:glycosyltransferase involved in cell wall biosynthesis
MFSRPIEALAAQIAGEDIQLIHAMDAQGAGLARRLGALTDTRFAVSSFNLADARSLGTLEARCAAVLAGSDAIRREILEQRVSPASKVHLVRPGVHQERHATCFEQADNTASIVAGCGLDDLPAFAAVLRALADLRGRGYECLLFVIGEGKAERELRMLCDELGLRQDLTFVEHQCGKNLVDIFKAADIYVAPSPYAGVDMGALLAMAGGVPVLAGVCDPGSPASVRPGKGGSCDFVIDGRTAGIFRSADAHDLADKLAHLLDDHAAARALAESALGYLRENHSAAKMVAAVAQIYRQVTQPAEMLAAGM